MSVDSSCKHFSNSMALVLSLVLLSLVLVASATSRENSEMRSRNHKALQFGRSSVEKKPNADEQQSEGQDEENAYDAEEVGQIRSTTTTETSSSDSVNTEGSINYVATTPKIFKTSKVLSRYEQGLEDYDEAANREERENSLKQQNQQQSLRSFLLEPILSTIFNVMSSAFSSKRSIQNDVTNKKNPNTSSSSSVEALSVAMADNQNAENTTALATGRYMEGDPLKGYYDFVITEGSYKFWSLFQIVTMAILIYSTLASIYFSKVTPLTSEYDYIEYLNGGRAFAGARPTDETSESENGMWNGLLEKPWFNVAANSFVFVMNAIENAPK